MIKRLRLGWTLLVVLTAANAACLTAEEVNVGTDPVDGARADVADPGAATSSPITKLDLLLLVDNSNSMADNQAQLMAQMNRLIETLVSPACQSAENPTPHTCNPLDASDVPVASAMTDIRVGIVSSDLGTPGSVVPGCDNSQVGDNGVMNPIRYGPSEMTHEPWVGGTIAPMAFGRPDDCMDAAEYPAFLSFTAGATDVTQFVHDFQCNAGLYANGCGLESQLESVQRALLGPNNSASSNPNAGFVRDDAILAIVFFTDEEDGSVRDAAYANALAAVHDATDVYNAASTAWSSAVLNLRFYLYQPGSAQDPTWNLDRYVDPTNATAGWLALKPGHPERVIVAAVTGVPLSGWTNSDGSTNWDALLGAPAADANDFFHRDSTTAINTMSAEGPVSMVQASADPNCPERTVPACRRENSTYDPVSCTPDVQYFAWPARRIVEIARRMDQAPLCGGQPCHNGMVASICADDFGSMVDQLARQIQNRIAQ